MIRDGITAICLATPHGNRFWPWSTEDGKPVTRGMTEAEFMEYVYRETGYPGVNRVGQRMEHLRRTGVMEEGSTLQERFRGNRAGPGEVEATVEDVAKRYARPGDITSQHQGEDERHPIEDVSAPVRVMVEKIIHAGAVGADRDAFEAWANGPEWRDLIQYIRTMEGAPGVETTPHQVACSNCGKGVSSPVPRGTVVRAWVMCPECVESESMDGETEE